MPLLPVLAVFAVIFPFTSNDLAKLQIMGEWRIVASESPDGKLVKADESDWRIVIRGDTIAMRLGSDLILQADYRLDVSKTPHVIRELVTYAPCGAGRELTETYSFDGTQLKLGGLVLQKVRR